ncbi:MAG: hypothetical protein EPO08_04750 [Rhodospirillaceae bacterium]|nr:MAG: hypothetical protein EPO08_04750 [Rhodospirillaceae bacterium]
MDPNPDNSPIGDPKPSQSSAVEGDPSQPAAPEVGAAPAEATDQYKEKDEQHPPASAQAAKGSIRRRRARFMGTAATSEEGGAVDVWLISYADMVTLLMTVFIILVLIATVGTGGPNGAGGPGGLEEGPSGGGMSGARGFLYNLFELRAMSPYADNDDYLLVAREGTVSKLTPEQRAALTVIKDQDLERLQRRQDALADIEKNLAHSKLDQYVKATIEGDGIRVSIPDPIIFGTGVSDVDPRGMAVLRALVPILAAGDYAIAVEGHTDNTPVLAADRYPSNWELSAGRAATIVRFLIGSGIDPKRLEAAGYADTRPIMSNSTEAGRAQNRRVTFLLRL